MGKPCNKCGQQIGWRQEGDKWTPLNADGSDHKSTCSGKPTSDEVQFKVQETKVIWGKIDKPTQDQEILSEGLRQIRLLAYEFTKENHPELSDNSNLFGTIVNANITHLIGLAQIKATKESS